MKKVELSKSYMFNEKETNELEMRLDELTGNDLIKAEKELAMTEQNAPMLVELSKSYQSIVAAIASGTTSDFIRDLNIKDFSMITIEVQNFFARIVGEKDVAETIRKIVLNMSSVAGQYNINLSVEYLLNISLDELMRLGISLNKLTKRR